MSEDTNNWLKKIGLEQYTDTFAENDIDLDVLPELSEQDLKDIGISLGHRKKLLKAIASLDTGSAAADPEPKSATLSQVTNTPETDPERRYLTLMFCDLADSTKLSAHMDMEDVHEINRAFQETCTLAINKISGFVARYMGDGILAYFGYPTAHENDAERAVIAGLEITRAIKKLSERYNLPDGMQLNVRVGIATGPVVVEIIGSGASQESAVVGEAPNLAARLQSFAAPNSLVIEPATKRLLDERYQLESLGSHPMKGFSGPIEVWAVLGEENRNSFEAPSNRYYATPLIGRDEEMGLLMSRWQRVKSGEGQVVLLSGEAGIGKSRVTQALLDQVKPEAAARIRFFCSPYHTQTALHPFLSQIQRESGVSPERENRDNQSRLEQVLLKQYGFSRDILAIIASMISVELDEQYVTTERDAVSQLNLLQAALVEFLVSASKLGPVLLVVEDSHWIDPTSRNLLDTLVSECSAEQLYILANSRPESLLSYNDSHVTKLSLNKLSERDTNQMIQQISADSGLSESIIKNINIKSDGIPLYIEEVTKMLIENQPDVGEGSMVADQSAMRVPDSLQASLLSRLDKLGDTKAIAQAAAVAGEGFDPSIIQHLSEKNESTVQSSLDLLVDSDVIVRYTSGSAAAYRFRHALLKDAAYESLMRKRRSGLHHRAAEFIKGSCGTGKPMNHEMIAYHFGRAGVEDDAYFHWVHAGLSALEAGATMEAAALLDNAKSCDIKDSRYAEDRDLRYRLQMGHGRALNASYGASSEAAHQAFRDAVEISLENGSIEQQIDSLDYEFGIIFNSGSIEDSLEPAEKMLAIGVENDHLIGRISGYQVLGMAYYTLGEFEQARFALESALDTKGQIVTGINSYPSMTLDYLSYVLFALGEEQAARSRCEEAIASARSESSYSTASALYNSSITRYMLGEFNHVNDYAKELIQITEETGQFMYLNRGHMLQNLVLAGREQDSDALDFVVAASEKLLESGEEIDMTFTLGVVAELQIGFNRYRDAKQSLDQALALAEKNSERFYLAELYRLKALLARADSSLESLSALDLLEKAYSVATEQDAKGWIDKIQITREQER
ncbi:MAG: AAA family ATPase [Pseudomonadota bacterium]